MKLEAADSSEWLETTYQTQTQCHNPEGHNVILHCREGMKSHSMNCFTVSPDYHSAHEPNFVYINAVFTCKLLSD
jgi:hypothetical protein